jgi:hypothetical protein
LSEPRNILIIDDFSHYVASRMGENGEFSESHCDWPVQLDPEMVCGVDITDLGDLEILEFNTPGHASCSSPAYAPKLRALFSFDGGDILYKDTIIAAPNSVLPTIFRVSRNWSLWKLNICTQITLDTFTAMRPYHICDGPRVRICRAGRF